MLKIYKKKLIKNILKKHIYRVAKRTLYHKVDFVDHVFKVQGQTSIFFFKEIEIIYDKQST
jgi:hypothetical protein